ncbi:helicase associated domain-containing protein [Anaerostipes hadrus]|uniref:helicase associated domain-containing protein n=1 Tax=Anaerostipes hadrus TaxID=649756 RepID=UPI001FC82091|nr:helicase associated domain-containing protein [Anaerostipes hadrus]
MINDTWIRNYEIAKEYYLEHGDLNVPSKTKLYSWISAQKYAYRGKRGNWSRSVFQRSFRRNMIFLQQSLSI